MTRDSSPWQISNFSERTSHRRRVGFYCAAVSEKLGLNAEHRVALALANEAFIPFRVRDNAGTRLAPSLLEVADPDVGQMTAKGAAILLAVGGNQSRTSPDVQLAARILDVCESLDSVTEFAAYEETDLMSAQREFLDDLGMGEDRIIRNSLKELTTARWLPSLHVRTLPVLPSAAIKLMKTSAASCSAAELESIAALDPLLTARLLGTANSAAFGRETEVSSLCGAILWVGVPFARKVLWSACCEQMFASSGLQDLWQHSRKVAAVAHHLAASCQSDQESAYVAGLLHDIGRLLLWTAPAERKIAEETLLRHGFPLVYAETLLYGEDHAGLGGGLLQRWAIPSHIAEAVRWHHRPESTDSTLAAILCLAENAVCDESKQEHLSPSLRRLAAARILGLDTTDLRRLNQKFSGLAMESYA